MSTLLPEEVIIDFKDTITVIIYSIITTAFAEFGTWVMIYRKDEYKDLKKNIETVTNKLTKQKEVYVASSQSKNQEKKVGQIEAQLKQLNQEMSAFRMKSTLLIALFMIITLSSFGSVFQGVVVARLPFVPFSLLQSLTFRGLQGDDFTHCSYIFIYILTAFVFRTNIQKIFGFEPPRSHMNPWGMTPPSSKQY